MTDDMKENFISLLSEHGSVTHVCGLLGISRMCAYAHRADDDVFREAWDSAVVLGGHSLLDAAHERAVGGSDTLLMFMLKKHFPNDFRDRRENFNTNTHQGPGGTPLSMQAVVNVQIGSSQVTPDPTEP